VEEIQIAAAKIPSAPLGQGSLIFASTGFAALHPWLHSGRPFGAEDPTFTRNFRMEWTARF
jgi:hypothetical protein